MQKLVLYDDMTLVGSCLESALRKNGSVEVIANYKNVATLISFLRTGAEPDFVLLSMGKLNEDEIGWLKTVRNFTTAKILLLCEHTQHQYIRSAFEIGVQGCILKEDEFSELDYALARMSCGERYLSSTIGLGALEYCPREALRNTQIVFTSREAEILNLIANGMTNQEISDKIFISKRTVEGHRQGLLNKMGTSNTAELIRKAMQLRIID